LAAQQQHQHDAKSLHARYEIGRDDKYGKRMEMSMEARVFQSTNYINLNLKAKLPMLDQTAV